MNNFISCILKEELVYSHRTDLLCTHETRSGMETVKASQAECVMSQGSVLQGGTSLSRQDGIQQWRLLKSRNYVRLLYLQICYWKSLFFLVLIQKLAVSIGMAFMEEQRVIVVICCMPVP